MEINCALKTFLLVLVSFLSVANANDSVFWTNDRQSQLERMDEMVGSKSVDRPLVLFLLDHQFDMGEFSGLAKVYSSDSAPLIPNLIKWISGSKGYSGEWITENVDDVLSEIPAKGSAINYDVLFFDPGMSVDDASLIVVTGKSLPAIDGSVDEVLKKLGNKKYRALLTGTSSKRSKRETTDSSSTTGENSTDSTYIKGDSCLFYLRETWVTVEKQSSSDNPWTHVKIDSQGKGTADCMNITSECLDDNTCNSTFTVEYEGSWTESEITVTKLIMAFTLKADTYGYWFLTNLTVKQLAIEGEGTFSISTDTDTGVNHMGIWSKKKMAYACWHTPTAYIKNRTSSTMTGETRIGLSFRWFEVQPFAVEDQKFTDMVDDCVPFFTAGTWMGLITTLIMILIFLFGISMITSLKTMDRFDDPKGKPLLVNTKES